MYLSHYALAWLSTFYFCSLRYTVGPRFRMLCVSLVQFIGLNYAMRISLVLGLFLASRPFCERNYSRLNDSSAEGLLRCHLLTNSYTLTKNTIGAAIFCFRS